MDELSGVMIELPYQECRFVMQVVLPDDRMEVYELENGLVEIQTFKYKQGWLVVIFSYFSCCTVSTVVLDCSLVSGHISDICHIILSPITF